MELKAVHPARVCDPNTVGIHYMELKGPKVTHNNGSRRSNTTRNPLHGVESISFTPGITRIEVLSGIHYMELKELSLPPY